jgi:RNA-dependent RNA polymerase
MNGIRIGNRVYEFLAFGNSQFRENGAYFFCPSEHLSCDDIRRWMGRFDHITIVAKYAARLGLCFSTTRAIRSGGVKIIEIDDVERNGYNFTDGVGKISRLLLEMIATELGLLSAPSVVQFRMGGCKGILAASPDAKGQEVHIRKSQKKFTAEYMGLEIIRCSQYSSATLNRQTITILSSLGVPDEVFNEMLIQQLSNYKMAMTEAGEALDLLGRYIDDNHMTMIISTMILNGFMAKQEPFLMSILHLWRSWSIKLLKEKAKIIVERGAFVLGCTDETATLKGHINSNRKFAAPTEGELPEIFLQLSDKSKPGHYKIVKGICVIGRNPSLHPGDIRVVKAVDVPGLHHLHDVVVFPQLGDRDIPSMCSGGDLDGDDFFVIWDPKLIPKEWNAEPMDYSAPKAKVRHRPVMIDDLTKFFVKYMKNDSLPTIAHAHLAQADLLDRSIKDPKCEYPF